ncbi:cysteine hydrolase family protein [Rhizobium sp. LEGMi198b]
MRLQDIDAASTALIILDMHVCIVGPEGNAQPHATEQDLVANIVALRDAANKKDVAVVFIHHRRPRGLRARGMMSALFREIADDPDLQPGAPGLEMLPELSAGPSDIVIEKQRAGAFAGTDLDQTLRAMGIDTLVLAGAWTNLSVESTARYGSDLGYRVIIASDGTASQSAEMHEIALSGGLSMLAEIATCDEVIGALR